MFACLHSPRGDLLALASSFSPVVELTSPDTAIFPIDGLRRLIGGSEQIASEICRAGASRGIHGALAIARDPDTAALLARNRPGVIIVPSGKEADALAALPIEALAPDPEILETFENWGIQTLADLAALPELGLAARFGEEGVRLQRLALGCEQRPLHAAAAAPEFARRMELDHPIDLLEPLLFVLSAMLHELTGELARRAFAAASIELGLELENKSTHTRALEFAVPCRDAPALLKLLQLDLEAHPPPASIVAARIDLRPAPPQSLQHGLFLPASPEPQKLQLVLARLAALVGEGNVGSAELLDTHRPDAYAIRPFRPARPLESPPRENRLRLAFRVFRPPLPAAVRLNEDRPAEVAAPGVRGPVRAASGPWRASGDWWTPYHWARDEWDVDLSAGLYRIFCRLDSRSWFIGGMYD